VQYNCEIEGCMEMTDGYLCESHSTEALKRNMQITICDACNTIIAIKEGNDKPRYLFVKDCMRCRQREEPSDLQ